ncbi:MAG: hypothetical protein ACYC7D_13400 [Nitrososphaerales archaeon]
MRLLYGEGSAIALIAPFIVLFLGLLKIYPTLFLSLLLFGIWTIAYALAFVDSAQKLYYLAWGLITASISTAFMISIGYTIALILIVAIALILYSAAARSDQKVTKAAPTT